MVLINERVKQLLSNMPQQKGNLENRITKKEENNDGAALQETCKYCNGTGNYITSGNGRLPDIIPCPYCQSKRTIDSCLNRSGVTLEDYSRFTLDTFDEKRSKSAAEMKRMALQYLAKFPKGVGFGAFGLAGRGKTHICVALCQAIARKYHRPHFYFPYTREIDKLITLKKFRPLEYEEKLNDWILRENLYIDDLLKFSNKGGKDNVCFDQTESRVLFDLLNGRYVKQNRTFFSSEYTVSQLREIDEGIGSRVFLMVNPFGVIANGSNERLRRTNK